MSLKLSGEREFTSVCGGMISICLKLLITFYFCIQLLNVVNYSDPTIGSYTVLDDRQGMEPANLMDNSMRVFFCMTDLLARPV